MDLLRFNDLDHSLLICPDGVKRNILNALYHQKKIIDVKFLTKSEFLRKKYFGYDEKAIKYLIDTYELSSLPYEDCCTIFTPKHPATHPKMDRVLEAEAVLDAENLMRTALENTELVCV